MKRLSDEVSTDQLTQIANRRGLMQAFEIERARLERSGGELSIGLLDIDNFKQPQRRARPQRRRRGAEVAGRGGQQDAAADRPRRALRRRGVRRAAARDAGGRGRAGPDAAAALADRRPLHAQGQAGLRHLLGRRHRATGWPSGSRIRSSAPTRRSTKPSGPGRTAPASADARAARAPQASLGGGARLAEQGEGALDVALERRDRRLRRGRGHQRGAEGRRLARVERLHDDARVAAQRLGERVDEALHRQHRALQLVDLSRQPIGVVHLVLRVVRRSRSARARAAPIAASLSRPRVRRREPRWPAASARQRLSGKSSVRFQQFRWKTLCTSAASPRPRPRRCVRCRPVRAGEAARDGIATRARANPLARWKTATRRSGASRSGR